MNDVLDWILDTVQSVDPVVRTLLAGLGITLETSVLIGLVVPGDTIVIVAATAIANPVEYVALVITAILGALAGATLGFALGRFFGPRIRRSRVGRWIGEERWAAAERYIARRGGPAVFLSRFLPVLHSLTPLTVGMSPMRYRRFIAWLAPACVVWAIAYVTVGWLAAGSYRELRESLSGAAYIFVGILAAFLILVWLVKKLLFRAEAKHMADAAAPASATVAATAEGPDATASDPSFQNDVDSTRVD